MEGYLYNADPYRQASAGYYAPRYHALEKRGSYGLPPVDPLSPYARVPLDHFPYGAAAPYHSEIVPRYVSAPTSPPYRSRPRPIHKKRAPPPPQNLGPKKKPFKQSQKVRFSEEKERLSSKKDISRKPSQNTKKAAKSDASLMKETKELHTLFRTGVDANQGNKSEGKKGDANGTAKKRKADTQMQKTTPTKNSKSAKKQKGKKKKKLAKDKKANIEKAVPPAPTEEEMKEAEAALEMQRGLCKSVSEFLGIPERQEVVTADGPEPDGKVEDSKETEKDGKETENDNSTETEKEIKKKPEEPQRSPEEEKEAEAKAIKFFSSLFSEHEELRNLYIDKCNSGSFECLVCHSVDATKSKKFWNVVSLVMHTKMRKQLQPEHSGYGRAVSAVLGWDHEKTPRVPRGTKPVVPAKKSTDQGNEVTNQEGAEKALDEDQIETEGNAKEEKLEENAAECPSEDVKNE